MHRKTFIRYISLIGAGAMIAPELLSCESRKKIALSRLGADFRHGHTLREKFVQPALYEEINVSTVIVGGGVSGLSAAYRLTELSKTDFLLLELNAEVGGNSGAGHNAYSAYPLGAHYLSLAAPQNRRLIRFLGKIGLITGERDSKQVYDEEHLCHAPHERLLFRGSFQSGLVPGYGLTADVEDEIHRFFAQMQYYRQLKAEDGNDVFAIPLSLTGTSPLQNELDRIVFSEWLRKSGYRSEELLWFLDYCCRDDYGAGSDKVSAWAGIHYFAGRKSTPANAEMMDILTWPEGNGWLVEKLRSAVSGDNIQSSSVVRHIEPVVDGFITWCHNWRTDSWIRIASKECIFASPSYVAKRVFAGSIVEELLPDIQHYPWFVAIVVLDDIPESSGAPLSWDNVKFGTKGLGYVNNQNQDFARKPEKHVISAYFALDSDDAVSERRRLFSLSDEELRDIALSELRSMHPKIEEQITSMTFQLWGHGMATPLPGTLSKVNKFSEKVKAFPRLHFVHTDFSGYSVFEEAFDRGIGAAEKIAAR